MFHVIIFCFQFLIGLHPLFRKCSVFQCLLHGTSRFYRMRTIVKTALQCQFFNVRKSTVDAAFRIPHTKFTHSRCINAHPAITKSPTAGKSEGCAASLHTFRSTPQRAGSVFFIMLLCPLFLQFFYHSLQMLFSNSFSASWNCFFALSLSSAPS